MQNAPWNFRPLMNTVRRLVVFGIACGTICGAMAAETPGFDSQVAPILQKNCLACHSSSGRMGGLVMENYESLIKGGKLRPPTEACNADERRGIQMLKG